MKIIYNPAAGRRRIAALWRVLDILAGNGIRIDVTATRAPGHAAELARAAADSGVPLVVGAGGDGTIAEVARGLAGSATQLGIIPIGTANILAHELALPFAAREVANALASRRTRIIWPGMATSADGSRLFVQMVSAGFDADVVHTLPLGLKRALGRAAYVVQALRESARYPFAPISLRIDGAMTEAGGVIVSKGRYYAGAYTLAPEGNPARPGFQVALFDRTGPAAALLYGALLPLGLLARLPSVRIVAASVIEIIGGAGIPVQADGDAAGYGPITISDALTPLTVVTG